MNISHIHHTSTVLAADLAGARVDPNEAQKAMAYLRSTRDSKEFFRYLRSINANGGIVIRSGQTMGYYRDLLAACDRHLHGLNADEMLQTLGWALRLLRYYRAVPDAQQWAEQPPAKKASDLSSQKPKELVGLAVPQIPAVGAILRLDIANADTESALLTIPGFTADKVVGVIENLGGRQLKAGNTAWVKVLNVRTLKSGRVIVELEPTKERPAQTSP